MSVQSTLQKKTDGLSAAELWEKYRRAIGNLTDALVELGEVVVALRDSGEDLSEIAPGLRRWLIAIGERRLLPEAFKAFSGSETMLRTLSRLSPEVQEKIVAYEPIPVLRFTDEGKKLYNIKPSLMPATDIPNVIGPDGVRSEGEQLQLHLSRQANQRGDVSPPPTRLPYEYLPSKKRVRFRQGVEISIKELEKLVAVWKSS